MPYIPNFNPPSSWFAGRMFLGEANKFSDEVNENPDAFTFIRFIKSVEMIFRGIRSVLELPPTIEAKTPEERLAETRELINPAYYATLEQFELSFKYHYYLWGWEEHLYKVTPDGERLDVDYDKQNWSAAADERKQALQSLLVAAVGVFREVYLKHTEHDRHYYGFWDNGGEEEDAMNILIGSGYCSTEEEARGKIDENDEEAMEIIDKVYFEDNDKDIAEWHDERFWEWDEEENIQVCFDRRIFHH